MGIAPGPGHDLGAVARADLRLIGLDQRIEGFRVDIALLDEEQFQRLHAQRDGRKRRSFVMVVVVIMVMVMRHCVSLRGR